MEILIIDDEPLVAKTLGRLLRPHSIRIIASSATALETVCEDGFDLIFCDLMMPDISGQELYALACEKKPELADQCRFAQTVFKDLPNFAKIAVDLNFGRNTAVCISDHKPCNAAKKYA